jgi:uncharacterized protein (DUF2147 family)
MAAVPQSRITAAIRGAIPYVALVLSAASLATPVPAAIEGLWLTDDRSGVVRLSRCGQSLCGYVVQVLDARPSIPGTDVNNPNRRLRGRPLVGLLTLWGFRRDGNLWRGGVAYDPKSGRSYRATLEQQTDGALKVTGCMLFVCESRRWTRQR